MNILQGAAGRTSEERQSALRQWWGAVVKEGVVKRYGNIWNFLFLVPVPGSPLVEVAHWSAGAYGCSEVGSLMDLFVFTMGVGHCGPSTLLRFLLHKLVAQKRPLRYGHNYSQCARDSCWPGWLFRPLPLILYTSPQK